MRFEKSSFAASPWLLFSLSPSLDLFLRLPSQFVLLALETDVSGCDSQWGFSVERAGGISIVSK